MKKQFTKACVIGRFSPVMHRGHVNMVRKALEVSKEVYILIGSANKFPDVKNPIIASDRENCIWEILKTEFPHEDCKRIRTRQLNDYKYNDEKWKTEVRTLMNEQRWDNVAMVGFEKDQDSYWLHEFGWDHVEVEPVMVNWYGVRTPMSNTFIRDTWLRTGDVVLSEVLPKASVDFLHKFVWNEDFLVQSPEFIRLQEERVHWDKELKKFEKYPYVGSLHHCCADAVVLCNNHVLLIERKFAPGKGALALPGGHKDENETFRYAALRELEEEVGLKVPAKVIRGSIRDQHLFDDPNRTAVFCKPTVAQFIVLEPDHNGKLPRLQAGSDAKRAMWIPLHEVKRNPARLFDDHYEILTHFIGL